MRSQGWAVAIGLVAGFIGGLFGVGGGIIVVPALVLLLGFTQHHASATSTATIVASSGAALATFALEGAVDIPAAAVLVAGASIGAWWGAHHLHRISEVWLLRAFTAVMVLTVVRLVLV
ncbi:MAG: TSUP family transporter [Acidimicrobiia bacterium]